MTPKGPSLHSHVSDSLPQRSLRHHSSLRRNSSRVMVGSPSSSPSYRVYRKSLPVSIDHTSAEQEREFLRRSYEISHHRSHRMDFSPEVSIVEATETGSRTRQGAALWSRHSLGTRWMDSSNPRDGMIDRSMNLALPREENESRVFRHSHIADSDSSISVVSFLCVRHPCLQ